MREHPVFSALVSRAQKKLETRAEKHRMLSLASTCKCSIGEILLEFGICKFLDRAVDLPKNQRDQYSIPKLIFDSSGPCLESSTQNYPQDIKENVFLLKKKQFSVVQCFRKTTCANFEKKLFPTNVHLF